MMDMLSMRRAARATAESTGQQARADEKEKEKEREREMEREKEKEKEHQSDPHDRERMRPTLLARRSQNAPLVPSQIKRSPTEAFHHHLHHHPHYHSHMHDRERESMQHANPLPSHEEDSAPRNSSIESAVEGELKEKKKGVSFLSRFMPGVNNKKSLPSDQDSDSRGEDDSTRPEGTEAQLFSHDADDVEGIEFHPRHPQPPPYIKFRSKWKKQKEFNRVFLAQELQAGRPRPPRRRTTSSMIAPEAPLESDENAVWAMEFSKDGKYLAAAGQDKVVRVWSVLSTPEERRTHEREEAEEPAGPGHLRLEAPVFQKMAIREYEGHEAPVIDLSWSKNNFLLSASADKTVRLWHTSQAECLCTFKHTEVVHSVQFHPRDDRFFLAGSRDMKLRFWSIPDKSVAFWQQLHEIITAVAFTPDGKVAIAGTISGVCNFYETEGLKYQTQLHVKSAYGKNAKGSKICSIETMNMSEQEGKDLKLLISSNDSRIRLYNYRDKSLEMKFKSHKSEERTIKARFSDNGQYIISGSEDKGAYIWGLGPAESEKPGQRPVEFFEATTSQTMCAVSAPTKTRQLLAQSEDPIYDVCNPPPVTLLSRSESVASSRAPTEPYSRAGTPRTTDSPLRKPTESPQHVARSTHPDGNVLVTASSTGVIRVYRQDCAFSKRRAYDDMSALFGAKRPSSVIMSRALSRKSSGHYHGGRSDSNSTQPPTDRIMAWRERVGSTHSLALDRKQSDARSISPTKSGYSFRRSGSIRRSNPVLAAPVRHNSQDSFSATATGGTHPLANSSRAPTAALQMTPTASERAVHPTPSTSISHSRTRAAHTPRDLPSPSPSPSQTPLHIPSPLPSPSPSEPVSNPLWINGAQSFLSWDRNQYASQALKARGPSTGPGERQPSWTSVISRLSVEDETLPVAAAAVAAAAAAAPAPGDMTEAEKEPLRIARGRRGWGV